MSSEKRDHLRTLYEGIMGRSFANNPATLAHQIKERSYLRALTEWSCTRFRWNNLPEDIDMRFLERTLFLNGHILFYFDARYNQYMAVRAAQREFLNVYDNPTKFRTIDRPGYEGIEVDADDAVVIWSNYSRLPDIDVVMLYSQRLATIDTTLDIMAKNMRRTKVIACEEGQRLTYANLLRNADRGDPVVFGTSSLDLNAINVLDVSENPQAMVSLRLEKNQVWNEAMTLLGISNANADKKERLVVDEVNANEGQIFAARQSALLARKQACEVINRRWNLDVSVEWNTPEPDDDHGTMEEGETEEDTPEEGEDDPRSHPKENGKEDEA